MVNHNGPFQFDPHNDHTQIFLFNTRFIKKARTKKTMYIPVMYLH